MHLAARDGPTAATAAPSPVAVIHVIYAARGALSTPATPLAVTALVYFCAVITAAAQLRAQPASPGIIKLLLYSRPLFLLLITLAKLMFLSLLLL